MFAAIYTEKGKRKAAESQPCGIVQLSLPLKKASCGALMRAAKKAARRGCSRLLLSSELSELRPRLKKPLPLPVTDTDGYRLRLLPYAADSLRELGGVTAARMRIGIFVGGESRFLEETVAAAVKIAGTVTVVGHDDEPLFALRHRFEEYYGVPIIISKRERALACCTVILLLDGRVERAELETSAVLLSRHGFEAEGRVLAIDGFEVVLPKGVAPPTGIRNTELAAALAEEGATLPPPRFCGWSFKGRNISEYKISKYISAIDRRNFF